MFSCQLIVIIKIPLILSFSIIYRISFFLDFGGFRAEISPSNLPSMTTNQPQLTNTPTSTNPIPSSDAVSAVTAEAVREHQRQAAARQAAAAAAMGSNVRPDWRNGYDQNIMNQMQMNILRNELKYIS